MDGQVNLATTTQILDAVSIISLADSLISNPVYYLLAVASMLWSTRDCASTLLAYLLLDRRVRGTGI